MPPVLSTRRIRCTVQATIRESTPVPECTTEFTTTEDFIAHLQTCPAAKTLRRQLLKRADLTLGKNYVSGYPVIGPPEACGLYAEALIQSLSVFTPITFLLGEALLCCLDFDDQGKLSGT